MLSSAEEGHIKMQAAEIIFSYSVAASEEPGFLLLHFPFFSFNYYILNTFLKVVLSF